MSRKKKKKNTEVECKGSEALQSLFVVDAASLEVSRKSYRNFSQGQSS